MSTRDVGFDGFRAALLVVLVVSLLLRLASIRHGLPFAYNPDEELHYVPQAARAADGDWYPGYFENPSGFTYLVTLVLTVVLPGRDMTTQLAEDPTAVFLVARVVAALLGTATVALVFLAGRRLVDRRTGVWAAALIGFAFLPVFYSHQALNDVPTLLPTAAALAACALVLDRGSWRDLVLAGAAVGLAAGTKYLAAPMVVTIALAVLLNVVRGRTRPWTAIARLAGSAVACVLALLALNPFIAIDFPMFWSNVTGQSAQASTGKLGQSGSAWVDYPLTLLWGFGAVPVALALVGLVLLWRRDRDRALLLAVFPVLLYLAMAGQGRYFGRWLLPAYPALAVLAGYAAVRATDALSARFPRLGRRGALALVAVVALAQPLADSVRSDVVLARTDTRAIALARTVNAVPAGERIAVEPAVPDSWEAALTGAGLVLDPVARPFQAYEQRLEPETVDRYLADGVCWVLVNSHQRDRGLAAGLDDARDYYAELAARSDRVFIATPFAAGATPPAFSYDFSFNYYPPAHRRPGPVIELRHLRGCSSVREGS